MGKVSNVSPRAHIRRRCARQPSVSGLLSTPIGRGWPFFPPRRGRSRGAQRAGGLALPDGPGGGGDGFAAAAGARSHNLLVKLF